MGKRGRPPEGEQMDLMDVGPENQEEIVRWAQAHKHAMRERMKWGKQESEAKQKVLDLIKQANLTKLEDGKIKVRCGHYTVTVIPRDAKVTIRDDDEDDEGDADVSVSFDEKPTQAGKGRKKKQRTVGEIVAATEDEAAV